MFTFPNVKPIWVEYLEKFVERYGGSKLERARDLFEQVNVPRRERAKQRRACTVPVRS